MSLRKGTIVLRPVTVTEPGSRLATISQKMRDLGIEPKDIARAIRWARASRGRRRSFLTIGSRLQGGRVRPVVSAEILDKYVRVLAYPKFELTPAEIRGLIEEELLPFIETVRVKPSAVKQLRDPDDAKFIACARAAEVRWLVSGDADLLDLHRLESVVRHLL